MNFFAILLLIVSFSCSDDDNEGKTTLIELENQPEALGMDFTPSNSSFEDTYTSLKFDIGNNLNINIVAEVNHTANAASVSVDLEPTKIIFFGNPSLGTPLMQENQLAGLDLPQKILVFEDDDGFVYMGFNNITYLANRHGVGYLETLPRIQLALDRFLEDVGQTAVKAAKNSEVLLGEGIITKTINGDGTAAYDRLRTAIESNENLNIFLELDHQANAASVDLELNPTRLIIFGNANLGTTLMEDTQTTALDLPQKILIWTDDDGVAHVSYNDPEFLVKRHALSGSVGVLQTIAGALENLSNMAAGDTSK